ncbi:MAG: hypothetical protein WAU33_16720 [Candidatus Binataceae bacterium]
MKSKSRLFAAMIALSIFAAPAAAYAGKPYRETAARAAAARVSASRNASFAARNQSRAIAPRNFSFARNFQAAPTNRGNRVIFDRSNWERNAALNNYASQYANQPRGYYNNYAAPIPIGSNCQLGGVNNYPSAYGEQGYGYGQTGIGQPALASYRGRLLAQKASLLAQLNSASSFMERPYLREQLAEVNKKLGAVDSRMGITGRGYEGAQYGGYNGYQQASPLAALTSFGGNGYGGYGQQGGLASALPMLGNYIR